MSSNFRIYRLIIFLFVFFFSCQGPQTSNREKISMKEVDSLRTVYYNLRDSIRTSWNAMMEDDNEKIVDMKRVLQEIQYTPTLDSATFDSLYEAIEQLEQIRYDQQSMAQSKKIDQYDSATLTLSDSIVQFVKNHPKYDNYPYMEKLIDNIMDANQKVLLYRVKYDNFAKKYNRFIENHQQIIEEIDTSDNPINKKPLFQLGPS